jgi:hypothetical protein
MAMSRVLMTAWISPIGLVTGALALQADRAKQNIKINHRITLSSEVLKGS